MSTENFAESTFDSSSEAPRKMLDYSSHGRTEKKLHLWTGSRHSLFFVLMAFIEAVIVIALESVIYTKFVHNNANVELGRGIPVYLLIFIICQVYQIGIALDAVRMKNTIQVIAFILLNLCCLIYSAFQFQQISDALTNLAELASSNTIALDNLHSLIYKLLVANVVIIGVCELVYIYLGARLYQEFGWRIYKKIGADPEIRNMYRWYQILLTILKIDMFFFLGYSIQYLVLVLQTRDYEFPLTIVALPLTCLFLLLAVYAVKGNQAFDVFCAIELIPIYRCNMSRGR
ncbi:hypothetical protein BX666DRAFT_2101712 [Dichotomocladium elegans]|nr:hypothetical protein BX666DRAFT_2101712 [Dichotomocladium elegans]